MRQQKSSVNLVEIEIEEGGSGWTVSSVGNISKKGATRGNPQEEGCSKFSGGFRKGGSTLHSDSRPSTSCMSVSDNIIKNCNRLIFDKLSMESARKCWEIGKKSGVSFDGDEEFVIHKILEMEERDRKIISSKGVDKSSL